MEKLARRQMRHGGSGSSGMGSLNAGSDGSSSNSSSVDMAEQNVGFKPLSRGAYLPDDTLSIDEVDDQHLGVERCFSILVETGVYSRSRVNETRKMLLDHNHRDFIMDPELVRPTLTVPNVLEAIQAVFKMEQMAQAQS